MPTLRNRRGARGGRGRTTARGRGSASGSGSGSGSGRGKQPGEEPEPKHQKLSDCCPICLLPFREPAIIQCGHVFCSVCVKELIRNSTFFPRCPLCRKTL